MQFEPEHCGFRRKLICFKRKKAIFIHLIWLAKLKIAFLLNFVLPVLIPKQFLIIMKRIRLP